MPAWNDKILHSQWMSLTICGRWDASEDERRGGGFRLSNESVVPYSATGFPAGTAQTRGSLRFTCAELAHAVFTTGRAPRVTRKVVFPGQGWLEGSWGPVLVGVRGGWQSPAVPEFR